MYGCESLTSLIQKITPYKSLSWGPVGFIPPPSWWLRWWRICLQCGRSRFNPWVRKIPWRRKWQFTLVFLPGESHVAWQTTVPGITKSQTQLKRLSTQGILNNKPFWWMKPVTMVTHNSWLYVFWCTCQKPSAADLCWVTSCMFFKVSKPTGTRAH